MDFGGARASVIQLTCFVADQNGSELMTYDPQEYIGGSPLSVRHGAQNHDQLACGRRFRVLTIIDDVTKEYLAAVPDTSLTGKRVVREMTALIARRGCPDVIVSDNGTEFTSAAVLAFTQAAKLDWRYIAPGKPTENAFAESFRGGCSRCLNEQLLNERAPPRDALCPRRRGARPVAVSSRRMAWHSLTAPEANGAGGAAISCGAHPISRRGPEQVAGGRVAVAAPNHAPLAHAAARPRWLSYSKARMDDQEAMKPTGAEHERRAFILAVLAAVLPACAQDAEMTCAQFGAMTPSQQLQALSDDLRQELAALEPDVDFDPAEIGRIQTVVATRSV